MDTLSASTAVELVRKNLDELDPNASVMYTDEDSDNTSLDDIIKRNLPEAINMVHLAAPVSVLEGEDVKSDITVGLPQGEDGGPIYDILQITLSGVSLLRVVAFQTTDSPIVVTNAIAEASPEGRKQLNPHIRGRYDRPRLVWVQGNTLSPTFMYYSLKDGFNPDSGGHPSAFVKTFLVIKRQDYLSASNASYNISSLLRQNIIDCLTAKVMETYSDQRAQAYYTKALTF